MSATIHEFPKPSPALDAALARIRADFTEAAFLKRRVHHYIRLGVGHSEVTARYGRRLPLLAEGLTVDGAIFLAERMYRIERKAFQIASACGVAQSRLPLLVLRELRLMLRLLRRSEYAKHNGSDSIAAAVASGRAPTMAEIAEVLK